MEEHNHLGSVGPREIYGGISLKMVPAKVLVVDDAPMCRLATTLLLRQWGLECDEVESGFEALNRFESGKYAAVIMDYEMDGMTGAECTLAIRKLEEGTGARIPIIGLTSHKEYQVIRECQDAGMDAVLPKDCPPDDLFDVLEPLIFARSS